MKKALKYIFIGLLLSSFSSLMAQEYCLQFSKETKKTVLIKEGRSISFVFERTEKWKKGKITKITSDSLYIEQYISKSDILTVRESNYMITSYGLSDFRMMAYNNTMKAVGKGSAVVVLFSLAVLSGGAGFVTGFSDEESSGGTQKKFFKKNVDFDEGWKAVIVLCE